MSITYAHARALCHEIRPLLVGQTLSYCRGAEGKKCVLCFENGFRLLICLQPPFLRFHLSQEKVAGKEILFFQEVNRALTGKTLESVELLNEDRILCFIFGKHQLIVEFFPKKSNCYLTDQHGSIVRSFYPTDAKQYQLPAKPCLEAEKAPVAALTSIQAEKVYAKQEQEAHFNHEKSLVKSRLNKQLQKTIKRKKDYLNDLKKCQEWEKTHHEGQLLQSNIFRIKRGMDAIIVSDWEMDGKERTLSLDPRKTPQENISSHFQKSRKARNAIPHLEKLLKNEEKTQTALLGLLDEVEAIQTLSGINHYQVEEPHKVSKVPKKALPYREFTTASGLKIWVGKNAKSNEILTFQYAHGSDWWLHARDVAGSHVVLRMRKEAEPDLESLQDALQLALLYSKASDEGEVSVTQRKYVSRLPKGKIGQVCLSKHKTIFTRIDPKRIDRLKGG